MTLYFFFELLSLPFKISINPSIPQIFIDSIITCLSHGFNILLDKKHGSSKIGIYIWSPRKKWCEIIILDQHSILKCSRLACHIITSVFLSLLEPPIILVRVELILRESPSSESHNMQACQAEKKHIFNYS